MVSSIQAAQFALVLAWFFGFYSTWYLVCGNGTAAMMRELQLSDPLSLPNGAPLKVHYTGLKALDRHLSTLAIIFWPVMDGSMPNLSLDTLSFVGQVVAVWSLCMLEGMRAGNKGKLISYVLVWGLLIQNTAYALTMPVFFGLYLAVSPMMSPSPSVLIPDPTEALSIPFTVSLGVIFPSVLCALPAPSVISYDHKQLFMSIAQEFPISTSLLQQLFKRAIRFLMPSIYLSTHPSEQHHLWVLRVVYSFALLIATIVRISVLTVSITSVLFPMLFASQYVESLAPSMIFIPAAVSSHQKMSSIGSGFLLLLQYDELVGSGSALLWAIVLFAGTWNRGKTALHWFSLLAGCSLMVLLAGPTGCAVALIWARDELVIQRSHNIEKKIMQG